MRLKNEVKFDKKKKKNINENFGDNEKEFKGKEGEKVASLRFE